MRRAGHVVQYAPPHSDCAEERVSRDDDPCDCDSCPANTSSCAGCQPTPPPTPGSRAITWPIARKGGRAACAIAILATQRSAILPAIAIAIAGASNIAAADLLRWPGWVACVVCQSWDCISAKSDAPIKVHPEFLLQLGIFIHLGSTEGV